MPEKPDGPRKLVWLVDSLDRLRGFPSPVQHKLGFALYQAQIGQKHERAKILRGFAETVWQVRADDPSGTYRAVYVVQFGTRFMCCMFFRRRRNRGLPLRKEK